MSHNTKTEGNASWDSSAEDFGQKVDLTVQIRAILRNYPEGLSILKELIQNADDAGARIVRFCVAEPRNCDEDDGITRLQGTGALNDLMKGPSLIVNNSAKFTDVDFKSIQQIGDSLKKDKNGTKTGRFGVGVNSTYHLTDVPMFVSGTKVVLFDPQASYVPGINPANPGKLIDCSKSSGRNLVDVLPNVFGPLKIFGCKLKGEDFNGTTFRFALRTKEQATRSRLSQQCHLLKNMKQLLCEMASAASSMLLFLKNVECIEIYDWKASDVQPTIIHKTSVSSVTDNIRMRRSYVLNSPSRVPVKPQIVDYIIDILSQDVKAVGEDGSKIPPKKERWIICNQLGGGVASDMAKDPAYAHMKLIPWAGVAARLYPPCQVDTGTAYCFLPLPTRTKLPIHVNGYFELSSNRRDVWWGDDMAGDGKARAEWNQSLVSDIAAPSYCRLLLSAIKSGSVTSETYELLFPQRPLVGPWKVLGKHFYKGICNIPVLHSKNYSRGEWVSPEESLLLHVDEKDDENKKLAEILLLDKLPLVLFQNNELKTELISQSACRNTTTPAFLRDYFCKRKNVKNGALEVQERKLEFAEYLLSICLSDLRPERYGCLSGCQFIPLASGNLGIFSSLPAIDGDSLQQLQTMGFPKLASMHAIRAFKGDTSASAEWLLSNRHECNTTIDHGIDPYLACSGVSASLLQESAADTIIDLGKLFNPVLKKFFISGALTTALNIIPIQPDMLADVVARAVPRDWRESESSTWNPQGTSDGHLSLEWFADLWRFICSCNENGESLSTIEEKYCIVPTQQDIVCPLSSRASVIDVFGLDKPVIEAIASLGVRILYHDIFPPDLVVPKDVWSYIFRPTRDGVIRSVGAALRRGANAPDRSGFDKASDEARDTLFHFFTKSSDGLISDKGKQTLLTFPIFRVYGDSNTSDTTFSSMIRSGTWYVLEDVSENDSIFMTSEFLAYSSSSGLQLLLELGAKKMPRTDFIRNIVVPQLGSVDFDMQLKVVEKILTELPYLCSKNPSFEEIMSKTKFIPSAVRKTLKSPSELFDPEVSQLLSLMEPDTFPEENYCKDGMLLSLRSLGLRSTLSWELVIECAHSIEKEGCSGDPDSATSAKARGKELITFLDLNVHDFFPEFKKKPNISRATRLFRKVNKTLFENPEEQRQKKQKHAERVQALLNIKWMPILQVAPHPFLPWPEDCEPTATPLNTLTKEHMWLVSYNKRLFDGDVHSNDLKRLFGWLDDVSINDVTLQLRMLSQTFSRLRDDIESRIEQGSVTAGEIIDSNADMNGEYLTKNKLCQKITAEVGRIYHILDRVDSEYDKDVMKSILHGCAWLWMGDKFVSSDHVAFSSSINADPYLFTVPPDLACFRNLLSTFLVRDTFGSSDYCLVLQRMAIENNDERLNSKQIDLAVSLVQKLSDDILKLGGLEIYTPTERGYICLVSAAVYDDAPWLSKDLPGKKELVYAHPKISASVAEKIGIRSVRKHLLKQGNVNMISFGEGVVHEAFGQSESLTRRLKNIVEMYPEGPQQLNELIQNADDAKATVVKFILSKKQHNKSSVLGQNLVDWQGPALYCYNNSTFSSRDFQNLAKIGQASKLEKLSTTGRFGLGFNSVFHWTDVPSFVSGDHLVMFDPHTKYVPGATDTSRGIKIRFTGSDLTRQFPDQMKPYCFFGNDMEKRFDGTLFRFPFRNELTAAESEISTTQYAKGDAIDDLFQTFKKMIPKVLLFLRRVKRIEVYMEGPEDHSTPKLLYYADVAEQRAIPKTISDSFVSSISNAVFGGVNQILNDWDTIPLFINGSDSNPMSKEAFYNKLSSTPENYLPRTKHIVTINFVDKEEFEREALSGSEDTVQSEGESIITDKYLVCSALGAGKCREMSCHPKHRDMKFLPWASVATHLTRNGHSAPVTKGNAFCFLPLPAETGLPIHINGYFELSANRRDIWFGDDMTGAGQIRSEWNRLLLRDVISPLYSELLLEARNCLGPGKQYDLLWPLDVKQDVWRIVLTTFYEVSAGMPLLYSVLGDGKWVDFKSAYCLDATSHGSSVDDENCGNDNTKSNKIKLMNILLRENMTVVSIPSTLIACMKSEDCKIKEINPSMIREVFKVPINHKILHRRDDAIFLLRYCMEDLVEWRNFTQLHGLPFLPLLNGSLGVIGDCYAKEVYFVPNKTEKLLLDQAAHLLIDVWTDDSKLNGYLSHHDLHQCTNIDELDLHKFASLLSNVYPNEWLDQPEVVLSCDQVVNPNWISKLWDYIASCINESDDIDVQLFGDRYQLVPTLVEGGDKALRQISHAMPVVNMTNPHTGLDENHDVAKVLRSIGIRTFDTSILKGDKASIIRILKQYVQPPSIRGILAALTYSFPCGMEQNDMFKGILTKFDCVSESEREKLRQFLSDSDDEDLENNHIDILRSLPIYEVYKSAGEGKKFSHLLENRYLPPACADDTLLGSNFVKTSCRRDVEFLERLGVKTMSPVVYYETQVCASLVRDDFSGKAKKVAITKLLLELPRLLEDDDSMDLVGRLSKMKIVPNYHNHMVRPLDLYDPQETSLVELVDTSMLPSKELHQVIYLQSLATLGMKRELSSEGVLEIARQIEYQGLKIFRQEDIRDIEINKVQKRAITLLQFLDNESVIKPLLRDINKDKISISNSNSSTDDEIEVADTNCSNDLTDELNEIRWLPVIKSKKNVKSTMPRKIHELSFVGLASPKQTRPKADEWLCSSSMDILSTTIRSDTLFKCFKWDKPPNVMAVASQIIALSTAGNSLASSQTYRSTLSTVTSQIYEILDTHLRTSNFDEQEKVLLLLHEKPWIWVGDFFITTSQIAFNAPDNAKPYLYSVPDQMRCFSTLLKACGVKDTFGGLDFISLLSSLATQLNGHPCDTRQLDLTIFVARHLGRLPQEHLNTLDLSKIYLPSEKGIMHKATEMTYDDAPWLSAIVKKSRRIFVHTDVSNEIASVLGAKSLRDVLSAHQNGMVKIPCTKSEALRQLLSERGMDRGERSRVVIELLEIAEMSGVKQVSITQDLRSHSTLSLLHPCLAPAQGAALVLCFHEVSLEVEQVVRLTSPSRYYSSTVSGEGGCGGGGFPRFGRGLCASFALTDCLQVLSGKSFMVFDPNGEYFIEDLSQPKTVRDVTDQHASEAEVDLAAKDNVDISSGNNRADDEPHTSESKSPELKTVTGKKATARNYGMSMSLCKQFPDQFKPFLSLPYGVEESMKQGDSLNGGPFFRGTIIRIPLRCTESPPSSICKCLFGDEENEHLTSDLQAALPNSLLFTYNLQSISLDIWSPSGLKPQSVLKCRVGSSPISRRNHLDELTSNTKWKRDKSKLGKLFSNTWKPEKKCFTLQLNHRHNEDEHDIVDTFVIQSILGPSRLREMACTDALAPLNLVPVVTVAAHLHRSFGSKVLVTSDYKPSEGNIFVGLDTGIKTGLPFHINAPLFLHEWLGSVLLDNEDDRDFRSSFPGIRNVVTLGKNNTRRTKALALYVWNRQALTSAIIELVPSLLIDIRDPIAYSFSKNPRLIYRYWPYLSRIRPRFKELIDRTVYDSLASSSMALYLTEKDGFKSMNQGCFASPDYPLSENAEFFLQHMSLFTVPKLVVEDLTHFGIKTNQLTPSGARTFLKGNNHIQYLMNHPKDALAILEYCLSDLDNETTFDSGSRAGYVCQNELMGLRLLPLSDGGVGAFGTEIIVATTEQQSFLPNFKGKFLSPRATLKIRRFVSNPGFLRATQLSKFGPKILSSHISTVLPASWEGKDFVSWDFNVPSRLWIYQFWREVCIWDHDQVQLFRRWPLIPTTTGELASCGNARFILSICPNLNDSTLGQSLKDTYTRVKSAFLTKESLSNDGIENQIARRDETFDHEKDFWCMGESDEAVPIQQKDDVQIETLSSNEKESRVPQEAKEDLSYTDVGEITAIDQSCEIQEGSEIFQSGTNADTEARGLGYDPNSASFLELRQILNKIKCPLLDASFYPEEDLINLLPPDRLGVSRAIMSTLRQCTNYWTFSTVTSEEQQRLRWSELSPNDFDSLILFFSVHQGARLSLMTSDLEAMKSLPLFETFSKIRIPISERVDNFTIDNSVDVESVGSYLPHSLQQKLLLEKPQFNELYKDLHIECLNEATILQKFVLKEFPNMPLAQKEDVIQNLLRKWEILRLSDGLLENLRETCFVKRKQHKESGEVVFVKPNQLYDPRNDFFSLMFDNDSSCFPVEEFATEQSLEMLKIVGLKTAVDKETFLKCAYIVEGEQNVRKSIKLFEYFSQNFSEFYDNSTDFAAKLAGIQCVPAELEGADMNLYCFRNTTAPKDRHLTFKVKPVIHPSASPPQVMFSSLGIISPPSLSVVLQQLRALTENEQIFDHWKSQHGSVEKVFSCIFQFLEDNYSDISPRVKAALKEKNIVPVGTTFVKANRLFFRLTKDLAPFFYEVPRAFGANDVFLRELGVRDIPKSADYALSLNDLNSEIGASQLNANELKSVVEVVNLIASNDQNLSTETTFAPDLFGKLVRTSDLLLNDCDWLVRSGRLDMNLVHLAHPKMSVELCTKLNIGRLSEKIQEVLEENFVVRVSSNLSMQMKNIDSLFHRDEFVDMMYNLIPRSRLSSKSTYNISELRLVQVERIVTRFILEKNTNGRHTAVDVTNRSYSESSYCYIDKKKFLISQLPTGISVEIAVATALCDAYKIDRKHLAGISAVLSSPTSLAALEKKMGLFHDENNGELLRGEPGEPLVPIDMELAEIKPLKVFNKGEIVGLPEFDGDSSSLLYGVVSASEQGASLSRLRICISGGKTREYMSSQVYALVSGSSRVQRTSQKETNVGLLNIQSRDSIETRGDSRVNDIEESLTNVEDLPLSPIRRDEVLTAVQDLLHSANLSLNDDTEKMLQSNLTLQEELSRKDSQINDLENQNRTISTQLLTGIDSFLCPITREVMEEPVICADGHTYERRSIEIWLQNHSRSPKTNQQLTSTELIPNHALRNAIEAVMKCTNAIDLNEN